MNCDSLQDDYELHALCLLEEPERIELEEHLRRGCPNCTLGMKRALELNSAILAVTPVVEVPKRLRGKVLASVGVEPSNWGWISGWAAALASLLIAVLWLSVQDRRRGIELAEARQAVERSHAETAQMQQAIAMLYQPETRQVLFGQGEPAPPRGRVFVHATRGVLLLASNLPQVAGKTYELWVIPKSGAPRPAGLFQSDASGNAVYLSSGPVDMTQTGAVAVTLEPEAGSPAPTTKPVIVAALSD
ncbi:MAG TPA: anti-sigma factor [Bryobacteraceae bacterium]|nr:anti-sigma factor [Bryobacteraceae bacterium]